MLVDEHGDLLMLVERRQAARWATDFRPHRLPQPRVGGVDVQVLPICFDDEFRSEGALREPTTASRPLPAVQRGRYG